MGKTQRQTVFSDIRVVRVLYELMERTRGRFSVVSVQAKSWDKYGKQDWTACLFKLAVQIRTGLAIDLSISLRRSAKVQLR